MDAQCKWALIWDRYETSTIRPYWFNVEKSLVCLSGRMQYIQTEHFQF